MAIPTLRKQLIWLTVLLVLPAQACLARSSWEIVARDPDPDHYFGVTVANGMIGVVSSPEPLRVKDVVLNGVYDNYQRGRVSNILKGFNHVQMNLLVDGAPVSRDTVTDYEQTLHMREAMLVTTFRTAGVAVRHEVMALRHLPYTALINVTISNGPRAVEITPMTLIEAPDHLVDVRNFYSVIDRPHVRIPLMTSVAKSPTGRYTVAASSSVVFPEAHGQQPELIHEDWDYNMHRAKFTKKLAPREEYRFSVVASTCASEQCEDPQNEAERLTIFAALEGPSRLAALHRDAWQALWDGGNIFVEGDADVERDIRFALYHLYSFARAGTAPCRGRDGS
jgi:trehalose/maltose hydrolase-like predicted phosphorylase